MTNQSHHGSVLGFIVAAFSFALIYMASASPVPLFGFYRESLHLSHADLSIAAVCYFVGAISALLFCAKVSDFVGRRTALSANLLFSISTCLIFALLDNTAMLMFGRLMQGFACGLASSVAAVYVVDNTPALRHALGAAVTGGAPMLGLASGSLVSGALLQIEVHPVGLIFWALSVALLLCVLFLPFCPATNGRRSGVLKSLIPSVTIPKSVRHLMPQATLVFIATWSIGGFYLPFSASMASEVLGSREPLLGGVTFAAMMTPYLLGCFIAGRVSEKSAQTIGIVVFALSIGGVAASLWTGSTLFFLVLTVTGGVSWGLAFTGTLRMILKTITKEERAGTLATVFLISYAGAAVPNFVVSTLSGLIDLVDVAGGYAVLVGACSFVVCALNLRMQAAPESMESLCQTTPL
ncbi:MAG: MFS transporter [Sutterellaceae bacterium]|nr:MFS transporter [Sutterellaceae bacterium]